MADQDKREHELIDSSLGGQMNMWDGMGPQSEEIVLDNPFRKNEKVDEHRKLLAKHKLWLETIQHEYPNPYKAFRIGVYIRYFNQTKYPNYLDYHKEEFAKTIKMCPNWTLVDFYVDEGQSAPFMENAKDWCRLLDDCTHGKIDLIVTQKISNISRNPAEVTFCARFLATLLPPIGPIGIYFVSENLFTLASYYQRDMHETDMLPADALESLPEPDESESTTSDWERLLNS